MAPKKKRHKKKEPNTFHNCETEKITRKASDVVANLQFYRVVRFFRPRSSCTTHLMFTSDDVCVVHDDLGWKNWTTRYNRFWRAGCNRL